MAAEGAFEAATFALKEIDTTFVSILRCLRQWRLGIHHRMHLSLMLCLISSSAAACTVKLQVQLYHEVLRNLQACS